MVSEYEGSVKEVLEGLFRDYDKYWSLADSKYSGTLTLIHKRLQFDGSDATVACTPQSAIRLLLNQYNLTRKDVGLEEKSDNNGKPSAKPVPKQKSVLSFFAPKTKHSSPAAAKTTSSSSSACKLLEHNAEGRFQFFSFPTMDVIQTYVPNNGMKDGSFLRRRLWDQEMEDFFLTRTKILNAASSSKTTQKECQPQRPLLWCGDMNCAKDYRDGSHWKRLDDGTIEEWWTDESKCLVAGERKSSSSTTKSFEDTGIPSFTPAERKRFQEILQSGDLVDVWRTMHPDGAPSLFMGNAIGPDGKKISESAESDRSNPSVWDRANYTWRGHLAEAGASYRAKYEGKGQRLDYFLLSPSSLVQQSETSPSSVVKSCEILGYGEKRMGLFCGSDHCAGIFILKQPL